MRYRSDEMFEFIDKNGPINENEDLYEEYHELFTNFLYDRKYEIGDIIEFPDLDGNPIVLVKESYGLH